MNDSKLWYISVDDATVGPVATDLVARGIEHGKVPPEALVCAVGDSQWAPLSSFEAFAVVLARLEGKGQEGPEPPVDEPALPAPAEASAAVDAGIEVDIDGGSIDWSQGFHSYFLLENGVSLPEERVLLQSLSGVSWDTFREEEALWNLALCLAYGSDDVGTAAARVFFDVVSSHGKADRVRWMTRVLKSQGFLPSGIPSAAGELGIQRLQSICPRALAPHLE